MIRDAAGEELKRVDEPAHRGLEVDGLPVGNVHVDVVEGSAMHHFAVP